jgi:hypothetical protein
MAKTKTKSYLNSCKQYIVLDGNEVIVKGTADEVIKQLESDLENGFSDEDDILNFEIYELGAEREFDITTNPKVEIF